MERSTTGVAFPGRRAKGWAGAGAVLVVIAVSQSACGDGDSNGGATRATPTTATTVAASPQCVDAFKQGHNSEKGGQATSQAFLPSIRVCQSLGEWTAAERAFGVNLQGREAEFVDNTCSAAGADVQSSRICREAKAALNPPGQSGH